MKKTLFGIIILGIMATAAVSFNSCSCNRGTKEVEPDDSTKLALEMEEAQKKIDFQFGDARYAPDIMVGKSAPNISVGKHHLGYRFFNCHVRPNEAVKIDNFFTVFGYAINDVKPVNLHSRAYWNFVKTKNCEIVGEMPASSREAIARIFDGGIFFWKNGDNVGNFEVGGRNSYGAILNR